MRCLSSAVSGEIERTPIDGLDQQFVTTDQVGSPAQPNPFAAERPDVPPS
jgi:hypothetical protein